MDFNKLTEYQFLEREDQKGDFSSKNDPKQINLQKISTWIYDWSNGHFEA